MEELLARHRGERKDLQNKITSKKKNATKKTRKGVNDECDTLERELKEKQQAEVNQLHTNTIDNGVADLTLNGNDSPVHDEAEAAQEASDQQPKQVHFDGSAKSDEATSQDSHRSKKPNRQKARLARRAAEQEAQANIAAEEAVNLPDLRDQEMSSMKRHQEKLGLTETFIQPDGHCLYSACAHGMSTSNIKLSGPESMTYQSVRSVTASFISNHADDFSPFLEEPLNSYVKKIRDTAEWGGQLELQAIARAYNASINILQANGRVEKIEPDAQNSETAEIWLAYYKHSFGLGEHYNALNKT